MTDRPRPLVAGNWKMNGLRRSLKVLSDTEAGYTPGLKAKADLLVCPPATLVHAAAHALLGSAVAVGGQDCHAQEAGAFTGDISAEMLADAGATHVIVGHSERRADHAEDDATVNTMTFTEVDGRTTLTILVECRTREVRDAIIESGMEGGMQEAFDRLEQVASSLS